MSKTAEIALGHNEILENPPFLEPPFVNQLIEQAARNNIFFSEKVFLALVKKTSSFNEKLMLDTMNREIDLTALVSEFHGYLSRPDEVYEALTDTGLEEIELLKKQPPGLQIEVNQALEGYSCTIPALMYIDERHGEITKKLKNNRLNEAEQFKENNLKTISSALREIDSTTPTTEFEKLFGVKRPYQPLRPGVYYEPSYADRNKTQLSKIKRKIIVPKLPQVNREILLQLTPFRFQRGKYNNYEIPITKPKRFILEIRKGGDEMARSIVLMIQEAWRSRGEIKSAEDLKQALESWAEYHLKNLP
jgi:hypothetical protein